MKTSKVLVVDDSAIDLEVISMVCDALGCLVDVASDGFEAIKLYQANDYALVLSDYMMEPMNGIYVIAKIKEIDPDAICIMVTGFPDAVVRRIANEGMIADLVIKPIHAGQLKETLRLALNIKRGATEQKTGIALSNRMDGCAVFSGESDAVKQLRMRVSECASCESPLLLEGESGGDQLAVARFLHENGPYGDGCCVEVTCADMDEASLSARFIGPNGVWGELLEQANGGTLVVCQIESLPLTIQRRFAQVFDQISSAMHIIMIADTSIEGAFERAAIAVELYFKISMEQIDVPPRIVRTGIQRDSD